MAELTLSELLFGEKENIVELADGITSKEMKPIFYDKKELKKAPSQLYRLDSGGHRYYYRWEKNEPVFYTSVTTMIKYTLPTSPQLIRWIANQGYEEGQQEMNERAVYGTFLHSEISSLLINKRYDLDALSGKLKTCLEISKVSLDKMYWADDLKKDILAFAQFIIDYNIKTLAIEICLYHPMDGYAGAIDLVALADIEEKGFFGDKYLSGEKKGQPKESKRIIRIPVIIDLKSGRKGFYESHEIQLGAYKTMWNIHFPDLLINKVFNFSPKAWTGKIPSYNFKDQSESKNLPKLKHLVELAKIEDSKRSNVVSVTKGIIDITKGLSQNTEELTFTDIIKRKRA